MNDYADATTGESAIVVCDGLGLGDDRWEEMEPLSSNDDREEGDILGWDWDNEGGRETSDINEEEEEETMLIDDNEGEEESLVIADEEEEEREEGGREEGGE